MRSDVEEGRPSPPAGLATVRTVLGLGSRVVAVDREVGQLLQLATSSSSLLAVRTCDLREQAQVEHGWLPFYP